MNTEEKSKCKPKQHNKTQNNKKELKSSNKTTTYLHTQLIQPNLLRPMRRLLRQRYSHHMPSCRISLSLPPTRRLVEGAGTVVDAYAVVVSSGRIVEVDG